MCDTLTILWLIISFLIIYSLKKNQIKKIEFLMINFDVSLIHFDQFQSYLSSHRKVKAFFVHDCIKEVQLYGHLGQNPIFNIFSLSLQSSLYRCKWVLGGFEKWKNLLNGPNFYLSFFPIQMVKEEKSPFKGS